ncbi:hypothetical protein HK107_04915 [Parvularcula sp. ZS-1/3]|uniref:LPS-assembly lipoprotein LptE n=1 Tax=Parvularcula mediterranea TaxID=2732508 RepID=A0A7Y3RLS1_9PROT|nr:LPS assembly lipoprotein LptE [Parvularcula mediterranea]NNU15657.1 hypothetical protein [Parvularcula mediterranea]
MRTILGSLSLLVLTACGFKPLYATGGQGALGGALAEIELGAIRGPDEPRDQMRTVLARRLPEAADEQRFAMSVQLRERTQAVSVTIDSNARRFNYTLIASVSYTDNETNTRRRQNLQSVSSFAVVPSQYASLVAREDAVRRAVIDLARKIEIDAALYAEGRAPDTSDGGLFQETGGRDPLRRLEQEAEREQRIEEQEAERQEANQE